MKHQNLQIGHALEVAVQWYDNVPEPRRQTEHQGEVIGWRQTQVIVRIRDYAVIRFWKKTGLEVGNPDHPRRGFRLNLSELANSVKPQPDGVDIPIAIDTEA